MKWRKASAIVGIAVVGVLIALAVLRPGFDRGSSRLLRPDDAQLVALGRQVYAARCAACHGQRLEGQPNWRSPGPDGRFPAPPHDASGHTWHHADQFLLDYVTSGGAETLRRLVATGVESGMPAFAGVLSDDEIDAVLDYIASHWSEQARAHQAEATRQAEES